MPSYTRPHPHDGLFAFSTASLQPPSPTALSAACAPTMKAAVTSVPSALVTRRTRSAASTSLGGRGTGRPPKTSGHTGTSSTPSKPCRSRAASDGHDLPS